MRDNGGGCRARVGRRHHYWGRRWSRNTASRSGRDGWARRL